jgi:hypothetical protein
MTIDEVKKVALEQGFVEVWSSGEGTLLPKGWHTARIKTIDTAVPVIEAKVRDAIVVTVRGEQRIGQEVRFSRANNE